MSESGLISSLKRLKQDRLSSEVTTRCTILVAVQTDRSFKTTSCVCVRKITFAQTPPHAVGSSGERRYVAGQKCDGLWFKRLWCFIAETLVLQVSEVQYHVFIFICDAHVQCDWRFLCLRWRFYPLHPDTDRFLCRGKAVSAVLREVFAEGFSVLKEYFTLAERQESNVRNDPWGPRSSPASITL